MSISENPWEWPEEVWRGKVDRVRAGESLKPATWPGGAKCAVAMSFDVDHETNELRDGGKSIGAMSRGQYGNRQGIPRVMEIIRRHDIKASFYVPAVVAQLYPEETRMFVAEGHEVGIHGWIHERNSVLPEPVERDLQMRSADMLEKISNISSPCSKDFISFLALTPCSPGLVLCHLRLIMGASTSGANVQCLTIL